MRAVPPAQAIRQFPVHLFSIHGHLSSSVGEGVDPSYLCLCCQLDDRLPKIQLGVRVPHLGTGASCPVTGPIPRLESACSSWQTGFVNQRGKPRPPPDISSRAHTTGVCVSLFQAEESQSPQ